MKVELITQFFRSKGQRMTNLGKIDMSKLDGIITKHSIDIDYELQKLNKEKEQEKIRKEERETENQKILKQEEERRQLQKTELIALWSSISTKQQRWVCEVAKDIINKNRQKENEFAIKTTDVLEADLKKRGGRIFRESPTELRVNGIIVSNSYIEKMITTDEVFELMPSHLKYYKNIQNIIHDLIEHKKLNNGKTFLFIEE